MAKRHIWTINKTANYIKQLDPDTAITYSAIKKLVDDGEIAGTSVGTRRLVAVEDVFHYFGVEAEVKP